MLAPRCSKLRAAKAVPVIGITASAMLHLATGNADSRLDASGKQLKSQTDKAAGNFIAGHGQQSQLLLAETKLVGSRRKLLPGHYLFELGNLERELSFIGRSVSSPSITRKTGPSMICIACLTTSTFSDVLVFALHLADVSTLSTTQTGSCCIK